MLDDSLPTFRFRLSSQQPLNTLLHFTHNGSEPTVEYILKRPPRSESKNHYALGLVDVHCSSIIYGEVSIRPQWTQPSLSAAELRAQGGASIVVPVTPDTLLVSLYNPDQTIALKLHRSSFKSDSWEFDMPEHSFQAPSSSKIDQDSSSGDITELTSKVLFRWKRDSRLSKDMTCYMTGHSLAGKKSKEPDITIAMYHARKNESTVVIYEPNMARVEVEDRKGLEVVLLLSAEVIRDFYLMPKANPFNTSGAPVPIGSVQTQQDPIHASGGPYASGALGGPPPSGSGPRRGGAQQAAIDAETKRLQAMVAQERRMARERERREQDQQQLQIQQMLEREEQEQRRRRQSAIDEETDRLKRQYGLPDESPSLPPRPLGGGRGGSQRPRPSSAGTSSSQQQQQQQQHYQRHQHQHSRTYKIGNAIGTFLHGKDEKNGKPKKKRSMDF